jgi:hypothetical protein
MNSTRTRMLLVVHVRVPYVKESHGMICFGKHGRKIVVRCSLLQNAICLCLIPYHQRFHLPLIVLLVDMAILSLV